MGVPSLTSLQFVADATGGSEHCFTVGENQIDFQSQSVECKTSAGLRLHYSTLNLQLSVEASLSVRLLV